MLIVALITAYFAPGLLFGLAFFLRGYAVIAPESRGASPALRLLWTPAAVALWPLLCAKWLRRRRA